MSRRPKEVRAAVAAAAILLSLPALAQEGETEARGLTSPDVQESVNQQPTDQGTRSPEELDETDDPRLYELLSRVRASPPTLDAAQVTPRPNVFASEPAKEMPPEQAEDFTLFPENYVE